MSFTLAILAAITAQAPAPAPAGEIPRGASSPQTAKNWRGPGKLIKAQAIVDKLIKTRPDIMSITMHAVPAGQPADAYTMIAGSFPDRIGNISSPGDIITAKKGVTQVESKWGTPDYNKKVSIVLPLKDAKGAYLPVAMVIAFHQSATSGKKDTDFMTPGLEIRDALAPQIASIETLYEAAN